MGQSKERVEGMLDDTDTRRTDSLPLMHDVTSSVSLASETEILYRFEENLYQRVGQLEQALRVQEEWLHQLVQLTPDYMYAYRKGADGVWIPEWVSDAFTNVAGYTVMKGIGYTANEVTPQNWRDVLHPDDREQADARLFAMNTGQPDIREWRVITKQGEIRWLRDRCYPIIDPKTGELQRFYGVSQDITEWKRAEQAAQRHTDEFRTVLDAMTEAVLLYRVDGTIQQANKAFLQLAEIDEQLPPYYQVLTPDERRQYLHLYSVDGQPLSLEQLPVSRILRGEKLEGTRETEHILERKSGDRRWLCVSGGPIYDAHQQIVGGVAVFHDVTEQHRTEQQQMQTMTTLREANQLMDEFLGIAGHEIRTPLTAIKGNVQLAGRQLALEILDRQDTPAHIARTVENVQLLLARAESQMTVLNRLVQDLLDVARVRANRFELHMAIADLVELVRNNIHIQRDLTPSRAIFYNVTFDDPALVMADADRIGQVIHNYLSNALKYSPVDKPVFVLLEKVQSDNGPEVRVSVRDEGAGITREEQAQIWERFYRGESAKKRGTNTGLGLGLHICRMIIERHNGHVGVESIPTQGSTFWFTLPLLV